MAASTPRTSIPAFMRASAAAAVGLADSRSKRPTMLQNGNHQPGQARNAARWHPVPHAVSAISMKASRRSGGITHL